MNLAPIQTVDSLRPDRLWSLLDMLTLKARYFIDLGAEFHDLAVLYYVPEGEPMPALTAAEFGDVQAHFEKVYTLCDELKLSTSKELIRTRLDHQTLPRTLEVFEVLKDAVYAELKDTWFLYIPPDRLDYFTEPMVTTTQVRRSFPEASQEILSAGMCYALGLPTASVFHAMRAVEIGLRVIAYDLDVALSHPLELAEMGKLIGGIEDKISEFKKGERSLKKDGDLTFYSEAAAQFRHFNNGWRIRVSHARVTYDDVQAKTALDHVRAFFETLATRLYEPGSLQELLG